MTADEYKRILQENGRFFIPKNEPAAQVNPKLTICKRITAEVHEYKYFNDFPKRPE